MTPPALQVPSERIPTTQELMDALGYGKRDPIELPRRSAYRLTPLTTQLMADVPILRRARPVVRHAEKLGVPVTHLAVGSLKRLPPDMLYELMQADPRHPEGYPQAYGEDILLQELATFKERVTGAPVTPDHCCITRGGVDNIYQVVMGTTQIGDTVTVLRPSWPNTPVIVRMLGRRCFSLHLSPENGWRITPEILARVPAETKLIVIERPGNPTAVCWSDEELELVREYMIDHTHRDQVLYSDEEYDGVCDGLPRSALELGLSRIICGGAFSKNICATSARLGYLVTLDRRLCQTFIPWWNLHLGAGNWMNIQHAIARTLNDFGPKGFAAYVYHLNQEMRRKREIARRVFANLPDSKLLAGDGAIYDVLTLGPKDDATQILLFQLVESIAHAESKRDGPIPEVAYAVPMSGFQDEYDGYDTESGTKREVISGYRVTQTVEGPALERALTSLCLSITKWRDAGRPHLGTIEEVTAQVKAGHAAELMSRLRAT